MCQASFDKNKTLKEKLQLRTLTGCVCVKEWRQSYLTPLQLGTPLPHLGSIITEGTQYKQWLCARDLIYFMAVLKAAC